VRTLLVAAFAPRRRRVRSQLAVEGLGVPVGPGGPAGIDGGQLLEPVAFQAIQLPPQPKDLFGQGGVGQAVQVLGGQLVDGGGRGGRGVCWLGGGVGG
jgi:hypothetical protein